MSAFYSKSGRLARRRGFTLIELLVVITIITILTGISIITYSRIQKNARDGKRKSDLTSVQNDLELYYADKHGYPVTPIPPVGDPETLCESGSEEICVLEDDGYTQDLPQDPQGNSYYYASDGQHHTLWATMELSGNYTTTLSDCLFHDGTWVTSTGVNYCVSF